METPQWEREFGPGYEVPDEIAKHPDLDDFSWHNDASPSFVRTVHADLAGETAYGSAPTLFVDHPLVDAREMDTGGRFIVIACEAQDHKILYLGDDVDAALQHLLSAPFDRYED